MTKRISSAARRCGALALCLIMLAALMAPLAALAQDAAKTVRVGWYESSFNHMDQYGRRSGYAYEYQMKLSVYTGWSFEYVTGSWSELMEKLEKGEIDLMSDVSYTPEREARMRFSALPMGAEEYYLFVAPDNREISQTDFTTLTGKRVGVNKGSIQTDFYIDWARENRIEAELVEVTGTEEESLQMLVDGELDAYVTVDSFVGSETAVPICKIGSSDFYFAVARNRPDLLVELNRAMNRIQDENRFYNQRMFEKYIKRVGANAFLTTEEMDWLAAHGPIRVGYQDNYMAFCAADGQIRLRVYRERPPRFCPDGLSHRRRGPEGAGGGRGGLRVSRQPHSL